jgi:Holliday junction resolvase
MNAFEAVVSAILERRGYWTQTSFKVGLTTGEKRAIGRYSAPRWELDIVAYKGSVNELLVVECKSFLDSPGVRVAAFDGSMPGEQRRYKLFFEPTLRRVVFRRLERQLVTQGSCAKRPTVRLCLAAGKIAGNEQWLAEHFTRKGWQLWGPTYLRSELESLKTVGYENSVAAVVAKLLLRGGVVKRRSGIKKAV